MVKAGTSKTVRAQALGINRKNIYRQGKQEAKDQMLKKEIEEAHKDHPGYGHKRMGWHLNKNHKRIRRVMKKYGIKVPRRKVKKNFCTKSVKHRKYPNLIKELKITKPNQVWCSDTTRCIFHGKKWYLVTIIDIYTREIRGLAIGRKHDSALVLRAIEMALSTAGTAPEIFHSDQGTEFMAKICTERFEKEGTQISASDKASPWQNGYQESFFGRFKDDVGDINRFATGGELLEALYHAIDYYNNRRIHKVLRMPPAVYAKKQREKKS